MKESRTNSFGKMLLCFAIIARIFTIANNALAQSAAPPINSTPMAACNAGTAVASTITPCSGGTVDFTNSTSGSTLSNQHDWYQKIGAAAFVKISVGNSKNYTTGALTWPTVYQYYMQAAPGTCAGAVTSNTITVTPAQGPTTSAAGADQAVCAPATLAGNSVAGGETGAWTKVSGTGTITTPSSPTSGLTSLGIGDNVFQWTITLTSTGCTSSNDVTINNKDGTTGLTAYASTNCPVSTTSAVLSTLPSSYSYTSMKWQQSDNGGAYADIGGATTTPYTATLVAGHTYTYKAVFTNSCGTYTSPASTAAVTPYSMQDYTGGTPTYATADAASHCYNSLTVGKKYCFAFVYFHDLEIDWLPNGCAACTELWQKYSGGSTGQSSVGGTGCSITQTASGSCAISTMTGCASCVPTMYDNNCGVVVSNGFQNGAGCASPAMTEGNVYYVCFTVPAGCGGMSMCPQIKCATGNCAANPLPIQLLYFDVVAINGKVQLNWETATETNNDYFTLERSTDAANYEEIGKVKGAGNSATEIHYNSVDEHPFEGISYYRLKQTDYDGKFAYSKLVSVELNTDNPLKLIYVTPDPTKKNLQYQFRYNQTTPLLVEVVNVVGKTVYSQKISSENTGQPVTMDVIGLSKGVYFIKISDGIYSQMKKFIY